MMASMMFEFARTLNNTPASSVMLRPSVKIVVQLVAAFIVYRAGFRVAEVPITLGVRKSGYSKMAYTRSFWLGYARLIVGLWLTPESAKATRPVPEPGQHR